MPVLNGSNSNGAIRFEAQNVVLDTNMFNGSAYGNPNEQFVDVSIPLTTEGQRCEQATIDGQCTFVFRGDRNGFPEDMDYRVIAYPRGFLGSMGGRFCTAGFECGTFTNQNILPGRRAQGLGEESPVFDLRVPQAQLGLPNSLNNIDSLRLNASAFHCAGDEPIVNYFVDAYLYDTTQLFPQAQYSGTVNGINDKFNRMWNPNVWFGHPNQDQMWFARQSGNFALENALIRQFTGGQVVQSDFQIVPGGDIYKMVFKHESLGGNNFFYVGFVRVEMADGSIPNPNNFNLEYKEVLDYIQTDAFWALVQSQGQQIIQDMATAARPLTLVRPNPSMFLDGVAMGNEYFGMRSDNSGTICWDQMQWTLNGQTFGARSAACQIPFTVSAASECRMPLTISGNFDCGVPFQINGGRLPGPVATCERCPSANGLPKLSVPYGTRAFLEPGAYFTFPEFTVIEVLEAEIVSGNLSGDLIFNLDDPDSPPLLAIYDANGGNDCDTECGVIRLSYRFQCPSGSPGQEDGVWHTCCLDCMVCSFPDVSTQLQDETLFMLGDSVVIDVLPGADDQPLCPPIGEPPVGSFTWVGNGYRFDPPNGWWGTFDVMVPVFASGDKAHETMRCVTICRQGPAVLTSTPQCRTVVFVREKSLTGDRWIAAFRLRSFSLSITSVASGDYVDYELCRNVITREVRQEWTGSMSGQFLCGDRRIYLGRDLEIRIDKDVTNPDTPRFFGTARVESLNTGFVYNTDSNADDQQITYSLNGQGNFWATGWAI